MESSEEMEMQQSTDCGVRYGQQGDPSTQGYGTDGSGAFWCAVAKTQWGEIPGKARDGICWYSFSGKEASTSDFRWLHSQTPLFRVSNDGSVPDGAIPCGFENGSSSKLYAAIADTPWGQIPGRVQNNTCFYAKNGVEHSTSTFSWIVQRPTIRLESSVGPPPNALKIGFQLEDGGGEIWSAVADTSQGSIPGKAKGNTCWYSHQGQEHTTSSFRWIVCDSAVDMVKNQGQAPDGAIACGQNTDKGESIYAALANCEFGTIPGKAINNNCWFTYSGKEYCTTDFMWITTGVH